MRMTSYMMPEELIERLDAESKRSGVPKSEIVRRAVVAILDENESKSAYGKPNTEVKASPKRAVARG